MYECMYAWMHKCMYGCMNVCMDVCTNACTYLFTYISMCIYIYVCPCVCLCVFVCVWMSAFVYVCMNKNKKNLFIFVTEKTLMLIGASRKNVQHTYKTICQHLTNNNIHGVHRNDR